MKKRLPDNGKHKLPHFIYKQFPHYLKTTNVVVLLCSFLTRRAYA